jgi:hypothetical protein
MAPADGVESVRLLNPLSSTEGHLRRRLLPGLERLVRENWNHQVTDVRLFEIGTVFSTAGPGERPGEERHLAAVLTGRREPPHWTGTGESRIDLWDLKGQFEAAVALAIPEGVVQVEGAGWVARDSQGRIVGQANQIETDAPPWAAPHSVCACPPDSIFGSGAGAPARGGPHGCSSGGATPKRRWRAAPIGRHRE